jgi:hypothetical protein
MKQIGNQKKKKKNKKKEIKQAAGSLLAQPPNRPRPNYSSSRNVTPPPPLVTDSPGPPVRVATYLGLEFLSSTAPASAVHRAPGRSPNPLYKARQL